MKRWMITLYCLVILIPAGNLLAQEGRLHISGLLTDSATGEALPFAAINITDSKGKHYYIQADSNGFYTISNLPPGCYFFSTKYIGYATKRQLLDAENPFREKLVNNIQLACERILLEEVVIKASQDKKWLCCCCGYHIMYCSNQRFRTDSIPAISQVAPVKWYNLQVFPNPTANKVQVSANLATAQPVQLQILDASGKLLENKQLDFRNQAVYTIDLSAQQHGMYFFHLQYMGETHVEKVMKLR